MALFKKRRSASRASGTTAWSTRRSRRARSARPRTASGPYATREEAEHAMETARERNLEWENDPKWHDKDADRGRAARRTSSRAE